MTAVPTISCCNARQPPHASHWPALHSQHMDVLLQVGGSMASLHEHIQAVSQHLLFGPDIDFKLAESSGARNDATLRDAGFNNLAVNVCKELVTLGPKARHAANPLVNGATHLTPQEFHDKMSQVSSQLLINRLMQQYCVTHDQIKHPITSTLTSGADRYRHQ